MRAEGGFPKGGNLVCPNNPQVAHRLCTGFTHRSARTMGDGMPLWALVTLICSLSLSAACAMTCWKLASSAYRLQKSRRELELLTAELSSSFENLMESHKRLRSREGMRNLRETRGATPAETKAQARARIFGAAAGPDFARRQLEVARDNRSD